MTDNFPVLYQRIQELEALIAAVGNKLSNSRARQAIDYASTYLSDNVAEWIRTAEKRENER
jgi:hypothetical protein